jgi:beta-glucuronidase
MFVHNRVSLDLNGAWKFCPDPMQRCRRQQWWKNPTKTNGFFPCWDVDGLWDTTVPSTWKMQHAELKWYDGHAVYMRDFDAELPAGHEAYLVFDGALYSAQVYLNGQLAGEHEWGYSPFQLRVTELLRERNRLWVLLENIPRMDRVPGEIHDWCNDGGLINPVKLVYVPITHVRNFRTETRLEGDEVVIGVDVQLESRDRGAVEPVTVRIPELGVTAGVEAPVGRVVRCELRLPRNEITLWSPDEPRLYQTELTTRFETITDEIGYREIRVSGRSILLNGEPIRLYGICTHAEFKDTGRTATAEGIQLVIDHARELGCNFLRCAHYPYPAAWGRALDRAGLLWWEEVPAYWLPNMHTASQTRRTCGMLAETMRRDWNRASLIFWSVSNECCWRNPEKPEENNYGYWFEAVKMVRELDPSRLISCAEAGNMISLKPVWAPESGDEFDRAIEDAESWRPGHTDEWYALFDVLAANLYVGDPGEAEPAYRRFVEMFKPYNKPLMLSEFGSMSLRGAEVPADRLGSEARHAAMLREAYEVFAGLPEISGYCPWCLADIRVPLHWRWYNEGKGVFRYGILDEQYEPKTPVYTALREAVARLKQQFANQPKATGK